MELTTQTTIPYVANGCFIQDGQVDILNKRMQQRFQTDIPLAPSFDPRPVQTKYTRFGVLDERRDSITAENIDPDYYAQWQGVGHQQPFTAPTRGAPPLAYFKNVDKETALLRQGAYMFNSKDPDYDAVYQPPTSSELYKVTTAKYGGYGGSGSFSHNENTPYLFKRFKLVSKRHPPQPSSSAKGQMHFGNSTLPRSL